MEILAQAPHVQLTFAAIRIKEVDTLVSLKQSWNAVVDND